MARPLRPQFPGAFYHVIARGNARAAVFVDDIDRRDFLWRLAEVATRLRWQVLGYCLMLNHYHLALHTPEPTLVRGMRDVNGIYAQTFNRRHGRVGHLFQGRYRAIVVERDTQLLELLRYIVLNPVRARLCDDPAQWRWSSYLAMVSLTDSVEVVDVARTLAFFGPEPRAASVAYERFIADGMRSAGDSTSENPVVAGTQAFATQVIEAAGCEHTEVPRRQRVRSSLAQQQDGRGRDEAIRAAYDSGEHSIVAIARHFGHYTTVGRISRRACHARPGPDASIQDLTPPR
jgi:putative transposase